MRVRREGDDNLLDIQMAPLIDCVFILLIFFLVATTMKVSQQDKNKPTPQIPLTLPRSAAAIETPGDEKLLVLSIDKDGKRYVEGQEVSTGELNRRLQEAAAQTPKPRVRLDADRDTRFSQLIEIIELCQFQGLRDVGLHTRKEKEE